jgi:hypothetical protein
MITRTKTSIDDVSFVRKATTPLEPRVSPSEKIPAEEEPQKITKLKRESVEPADQSQLEAPAKIPQPEQTGPPAILPPRDPRQVVSDYIRGEKQRRGRQYPNTRASLRCPTGPTTRVETAVLRRSPPACRLIGSAMPITLMFELSGKLLLPSRT